VSVKSWTVQVKYDEPQEDKKRVRDEENLRLKSYWSRQSFETED
jgi:hypothetical protein